MTNADRSKSPPNILSSSKATGSIIHRTPISASTFYMPSQSNHYSQSSQALGGSITQEIPAHQSMLHYSNQNINTDCYKKHNPQPMYQPIHPHFSEKRQNNNSQQIHSNVAAQSPQAPKRTVSSLMYYQPTCQGYNTDLKATALSYPPGFDALKILADIAIRQPKLPMP